MGWLIEGICKFFKGLKAWLFISDWLKRIEDHVSNIESHEEALDTNLDLFRNHMQTLGVRISNIDEYGSKGAQKSLYL